MFFRREPDQNWFIIIVLQGRTRSKLVYNYCSTGEDHIKTTLSLITALYYTVINYNQVTVTLTLFHVYKFILKFILFYLCQKGVYVKHLEFRNQSQTIDSDMLFFFFSCRKITFNQGGVGIVDSWLCLEPMETCSFISIIFYTPVSRRAILCAWVYGGRASTQVSAQ